MEQPDNAHPLDEPMALDKVSQYLRHEMAKHARPIEEVALICGHCGAKVPCDCGS